ncbi:MAG: hypothetical protein LKG25_04570 [Prevotella sp.]|jgi:hypothetical protein|nr:hypothetical protein [Prevotella sp.]MCI1281849.1 hypothetical protein [Prevotella sp.]
MKEQRFHNKDEDEGQKLKWRGHAIFESYLKEDEIELMVYVYMDKDRFHLPNETLPNTFG